MERRNTATQDIENRSVITIEVQLIEFRQKQYEKFKELKNRHISPNLNENLQKCSRNTILIVLDSMLSGIDKWRIPNIERKVKVKYFSGATINDMHHYIKPLLRKFPDNKILHVRTNNTANESSEVVLGKFLDFKNFTENTLPESNVIISNLITRTDNGKASLTAI